MNLALDTMDPFVENWPFSFEFLDNGVHKSLTVMSAKRMNLLATPAVITPLAEVINFAKKITSVDSIARLSTGSTASSYTAPHRSRSRYKLVNKSGVPMSYWVTQQDRHSVLPGETTFLAVDPVAKAVLLPHANTKVSPG